MNSSCGCVPSIVRGGVKRISLMRTIKHTHTYTWGEQGGRKEREKKMRMNEKPSLSSCEKNYASSLEAGETPTGKFCSGATPSKVLMRKQSLMIQSRGQFQGTVQPKTP